MRRVCYVSGSRADFGLIAQTLLLAKRSASLDISVCVTGMHLSSLFGSTVSDIEATGLRIAGRVPVSLDESTGEAMVKAIGQEIIGIADVLRDTRPDVVMVLGDRGEMLAGALAAIHLNIPVVHIHGGERSGTVDEPVRHAISKLSHYHFVTTEGARERLIRMGEVAEHVFVTGAPGLDGLKDLAVRSRDQLCIQWRFDASRPIALFVFHPVLQQSSISGEQASAVLQAIVDEDLQALCLMPNSDAGAAMVREAVSRYKNHAGVRAATHLTRADFASWMRAADLMVGNSSSGIIEAATFGLPVVNVGDRQRDRERSENVIDVPAEYEAVTPAIRRALAAPRRVCRNVYGDGEAGPRIVRLLETLPLMPPLLLKSNAY